MHNCFVRVEWQDAALRLNVSFDSQVFFHADSDFGLMSDGCIFQPLNMGRENTHLAIALLAVKLFRNTSSKKPITYLPLIDLVQPSFRTLCICFHLLALCGAFCS